VEFIEEYHSFMTIKVRARRTYTNAWEGGKWNSCAAAAHSGRSSTVTCVEVKEQIDVLGYIEHGQKHQFLMKLH